MDEQRAGGCRCRRITFKVRGRPLRTGLCHCTTCRSESGSAFNFYAVWPRAAFRVEGAYSTYERQSFCPACGSPLFALDAEEVEIKLGALDVAPVDLPPDYELWTIRREHWLRAAPDAEEHDRDRPE